MEIGPKIIQNEELGVPGAVWAHAPLRVLLDSYGVIGSFSRISFGSSCLQCTICLSLLRFGLCVASALRPFRTS